MTKSELVEMRTKKCPLNAPLCRVRVERRKQPERLRGETREQGQK